MRGRRSVVLLFPLLLLFGFVTACGDDDAGAGDEGGPAQRLPLVVVTAGEQSRQVAPLRICDVDVQDCAENPAAGATMPISPGTAVRVQVGDLISSTPWQIAFQYREAGSDPVAPPVEGRTKVFAADEVADYTLETPSGAQLVLIEIQQFGLPTDTTGELTFPIRASWLVTVTPAPGSPAP